MGGASWRPCLAQLAVYRIVQRLPVGLAEVGVWLGVEAQRVAPDLRGTVGLGGWGRGQQAEWECTHGDG